MARSLAGAAALVLVLGAPAGAVPLLDDIGETVDHVTDSVDGTLSQTVDTVTDVVDGTLSDPVDETVDGVTALVGDTVGTLGGDGGGPLPAPTDGGSARPALTPSQTDSPSPPLGASPAAGPAPAPATMTPTASPEVAPSLQRPLRPRRGLAASLTTATRTFTGPLAVAMLVAGFLVVTAGAHRGEQLAAVTADDDGRILRFAPRRRSRP